MGVGRRSSLSDLLHFAKPVQFSSYNRSLICGGTNSFYTLSYVLAEGTFDALIVTQPLDPPMVILV